MWKAKQYFFDFSSQKRQVTSIKMKEDVKRAKKHLCRKDLQSVKVCSFVQAIAIYYKTKLCCYNQTIYENTTAKAAMIASSFTTGIVDFLKKNYREGNSTPTILYSNACVQNRNCILVNVILQFAMEYNIKVVQKYLVVGYTQMACDGVHATIDNYIRRCDIYLPQDYMQFSKECQRDSFSYDVRKMEFSDFRDYRNTATYPSIRSGKKKNDTAVPDLRALLYKPNELFIFNLVLMTSKMNNIVS